MRAWLEILRERHPEATWIPRPNEAPAIAGDFGTDALPATE
jgi:hypothetical protein